MKKTLLVLFAVAFGMMSQAQLPTTAKDAALKSHASKAAWDHIGDPFTTYDFRDTQHANPISLQAWLDSGFAVVVDYSCTWCGPCWNLHQAGILEGYYDRFGPNGTNQMRVIWIEVEESNTSAQITGTNSDNTHAGATYGDWTLGGTVPYPMADDAEALYTCASLFGGSVPTVFFIAPNGYYRSIYGDEDAIYSFDTAECNANMATILQNYPRAGAAPVVDLYGYSKVLKGVKSPFMASIVSVDSVISVTWSASGNPDTAIEGNYFYATWNAAGNYTVSVTVTNTTGSTSASFDVQVIEWGKTMTYALDETYTSPIGTGSAITWGAMYPAAAMAGRNYMSYVDFYAVKPGNYTITIYQGGENSPESQVYTRTVNVTSSQVGQYNSQSGMYSGAWYRVHMLQPVAIDQNKTLWTAISSTDIDYPAAGAPFSGDFNGSLVAIQGQWSNIYYASQGSILCTWLIKTTTSDNPLAINDVDEVKVSIYPNPATEMVKVEAEGLRQVEVLDVEGRSILTSERPEVSLTGLASGVYLFRVTTENGTTLQRIVKK